MQFPMRGASFVRPFAFESSYFNSATDVTTTVPSGIVVGDLLKDGKVDVLLTSALGVTRLYNITL